MGYLANASHVVTQEVLLQPQELTRRVKRHTENCDLLGSCPFETSIHINMFRKQKTGFAMARICQFHVEPGVASYLEAGIALLVSENVPKLRLVSSQISSRLIPKSICGETMRQESLIFLVFHWLTVFHFDSFWPLTLLNIKSLAFAHWSAEKSRRGRWEFGSLEFRHRSCFYVVKVRQ